MIDRRDMQPCDPRRALADHRWGTPAAFCHVVYLSIDLGQSSVTDANASRIAANGQAFLFAADAVLPTSMLAPSGQGLK